MIETTEHKATPIVHFGSVVGVRNERMNGVLALSSRGGFWAHLGWTPSPP